MVPSVCPRNCACKKLEIQEKVKKRNLQKTQTGEEEEQAKHQEKLRTMLATKHD